MTRPLPPDELAEAVALAGDWSSLDGARIFITGGTGFFGKWLLETLGEANRVHRLGLQATVLSRDPGRFRDAMPHLAQTPWLHLHAGDLSEFQAPEGAFTHLIHGAASSDARAYGADPVAMRRTLVAGTDRVMDFGARHTGIRALYLSSGAVYGPQPSDLTHLPEDHPLPPDTDEPSQLYAQGKREAERIASSAIPGCVLARCFAFAGPHLPLDQHFAFGNFTRDALRGGPIRVGGDGTPMRSYLYASELAAWLWALLMRGRPEAYHVGSDQAVSIRALAEAFSAASSAEVEVAQAPKPGRRPARYVPEIRKVREHLGLGITVDLSESIRRNLRWHHSEESPSRTAP